jgi:hypothetical protein
LKIYLLAVLLRIYLIVTKCLVHPYHLEPHQELHGEDFPNRVTFCEWAEEKIRNDEHFFERVVFTDVGCVKNNGAVNKHTLHYWAIQNPHWMKQHGKYKSYRYFCFFLN